MLRYNIPLFDSILAQNQIIKESGGEYLQCDVNFGGNTLMELVTVVDREGASKSDFDVGINSAMRKRVAHSGVLRFLRMLERELNYYDVKFAYNLKSIEIWATVKKDIPIDILTGNMERRREIIERCYMLVFGRVKWSIAVDGFIKNGETSLLFLMAANMQDIEEYDGYVPFTAVPLEKIDERVN